MDLPPHSDRTGAAAEQPSVLCARQAVQAGVAVDDTDTAGSRRRLVRPDPRSSPETTEHVLRGRVVRGSRAEVDAIGVPSCTGQVGLALDAKLARVGQRRAAGAASCSRELLEQVLGAVARAVDGPDELLEVAGVALVGLDADPVHRMAGLLASSLGAGLPPVAWQ